LQGAALNLGTLQLPPERASRLPGAAEGRAVELLGITTVTGP